MCTNYLKILFELKGHFFPWNLISFCRQKADNFWMIFNKKNMHSFSFAFTLISSNLFECLKKSETVHVCRRDEIQPVYSFWNLLAESLPNALELNLKDNIFPSAVWQSAER